MDNNLNDTSNQSRLSIFPETVSLAIAYVPFQNTFMPYTADEGLNKGTLFPCLYKPFTGKRGVIE